MKTSLQSPATDFVQPCSRPICHGNVRLILLYLYQSCGMYYLVRYPDFLRWQYPVRDAALHLRELLGEPQQYASHWCKCHFQATVDILHGLAYGVSFCKCLIHGCSFWHVLIISRCGCTQRTFTTSSQSRVSSCLSLLSRSLVGAWPTAAG